MLSPTVTASLYPRLNSCARNHYRIPVYPYYDLLSSLYSFQPDPSTSMHVACATARSVSSREDDDDVELRMRGRAAVAAAQRLLVLVQELLPAGVEEGRHADVPPSLVATANTVSARAYM